jgi:hypothetical protein
VFCLLQCVRGKPQIDRHGSRDELIISLLRHSSILISEDDLAKVLVGSATPPPNQFAITCSLQQYIAH